MNALKILAGLLELPKAERDMIVQLATKEPPKQVHRKITKRKVIGSNGQKPYTHAERVWLDEHFRINATDPDEAISRAMEDLGRSYDAIKRKWDDYARGRSDIGTWADWVKGGK